jgi:xanthine/CO dehydrogenase XdhC/CoxF family maturation factor
VYLGLLADSSISSIGLLGPRDRRRRLLEELGDIASSLEGRLQGPAGIDIGASGPAAIALSIVAQMHKDIMSVGAASRRDRGFQCRTNA